MYINMSFDVLVSLPHRGTPVTQRTFLVYIYPESSQIRNVLCWEGEKYTNL